MRSLPHVRTPPTRLHSCLPPPPQAQLLISLVPYGRNEPDGAKCRELYQLLSDFLSKGNVDASALCATLPALRPPPPAAPPVAAGSGSPSPHATGENAANNGGSGGGNDGGGGGNGVGSGHVDTSFYSIDGPLPAPASADEREFASTAVAALSEAVAADGVPALAQVVPLLVWLMRLIVQPRATAADAHLSGLLGLARIVIGWLGPRGKEVVGLRGLEGICAAEEGVVGTRGRGLLHHVYHECLFDIATHDNHGPLAPPKCRLVLVLALLLPALACFALYRLFFFFQLGIARIFSGDSAESG